MRFKCVLFLGISAMLTACSQTADSYDDEDVLEISSSAKKGSSSSSKGGKTSSAKEELDEDCVGEPGNAWDGTTAKSFACGSGTKLSPYVILTAEQLAKLSFAIGANDAAFQGKYFKLGADIKLNKGKIIDDKGGFVADSSKLHKWTPIGNSSVSFTGSFDGDGHTVSGMFINTTSSHNGLFGNNSGTVQNVTVADSWVSGGDATAGILGILAGAGILNNVVNKATVIGIGRTTGGVVAGIKTVCCNNVGKIDIAENYGYISGGQEVGGIIGGAKDIRISKVKNYATIVGTTNVGGIAGTLGYNSNLTDILNSGKITGKTQIAGVVGYYGYRFTCNNPEKNGIFQNGKNIGNVEGESYTAGVIGKNDCTKNINISNTADVVGANYTSGLFGYIKSSITENAYNTGDVFGDTYVGGVVGYNEEGVTSSAYSTGKVDGDSLVGLMIGYNYNTTMADYYYLEQGKQEPFGLNNGGGVATPKTSKEMKSQKFAELLGDEFVYDSGLNDGYPILKWEKE